VHDPEVGPGFPKRPRTAKRLEAVAAIGVVFNELVVEDDAAGGR
jgi:hypothetical protein